MCVISVFCISECEFIGLLSKVLKYRSGFHDFIHKYLNFNDQRLTSNDIHYLKQYHLSLKITGIIFTVLVIPGLSFVYLCEIGLVVWFYFKNIITSTQLILTTIMLVSSGFHIGFLITSLQISTLSAAFCTEFLKLRSRQSLKFLKSNHCPKRILIRKFQWNSFHREYVNLFQQTALLNKTISFQLYIWELGSKVSSITTCVFYSRQISMGISNTFIFGAMISVFVYITGLYTQLTYLPAYNQQCCRLLLEWIARQSIKNKTKKQRKMIYASIKSNLFTQTMNQNKFGFHCGQIFFITKFKVVELILMNIPLILLFYK
uniref:Uncharacterized protein LOC113794632 n=1 Tax=Dermatophagoides pteronyssinus TaxID=6956 RepID=A0A6P6Y551_DERPT